MSSKTLDFECALVTGGAGGLVRLLGFNDRDD
jgi:hypothetical protein